MLQIYTPSSPALFPMLKASSAPIPAPSRNIADYGKKLVLRAGKALCAEGEAADHCYKILSGFVRTMKFTHDGQRQICDFLMAGDLVGFEAQDTYVVSAEALTDCTVVIYPRRIVDEVLRQDPAANAQIRSAMSRSLATIQQRLVLLCKTPAKERLCWFLLHIADRASKNANEVDLPMARSDIADYLGLAIETVSRLIASLKQSGIIATDGRRRIKFLDREELEHISDAVCG